MFGSIVINALKVWIEFAVGGGHHPPKTPPNDVVDANFASPLLFLCRKDTIERIRCCVALRGAHIFCCLLVRRSVRICLAECAATMRVPFVDLVTKSVDVRAARLHPLFVTSHRLLPVAHALRDKRSSVRTVSDQRDK